MIFDENANIIIHKNTSTSSEELRYIYIFNVNYIQINIRSYLKAYDSRDDTIAAGIIL